MSDQLSLELELGPAAKRLSPEQRALIEEHLRRRPPDDADWQERYHWWRKKVILQGDYRCPACGERTARDARDCPHCGVTIY